MITNQTSKAPAPAQPQIATNPIPQDDHASIEMPADGPILFLGVKTNGYPVNRKVPYTRFSEWPRILSLSYAFYSQSGEELFYQYQIARPDQFSITPRAMSRSGISQERVAKERMPIKSLLEQFDREIEARQPSLVVAHNMDLFHKPVLYAECFRNNLSLPFSTIPTWCTMVGTTGFCGLFDQDGNPKWPSLAEFYSVLFGLKPSDPRDPSFEVRTCATCFFELKRQFS